MILAAKRMQCRSCHLALSYLTLHPQNPGLRQQPQGVLCTSLLSFWHDIKESWVETWNKVWPLGPRLSASLPVLHLQVITVVIKVKYFIIVFVTIAIAIIFSWSTNWMVSLPLLILSLSLFFLQCDTTSFWLLAVISISTKPRGSYRFFL